jgi:hypothetical protein
MLTTGTEPDPADGTAEAAAEPSPDEAAQDPSPDTAAAEPSPDERDQTVAAADIGDTATQQTPRTQRTPRTPTTLTTAMRRSIPGVLSAPRSRTTGSRTNGCGSRPAASP